MFSNRQLLHLQNMVEMSGGDPNKSINLYCLAQADLEVKPCPKCGNRFPNVFVAEAMIRCDHCGAEFYARRPRKLKGMATPFNDYRAIRTAAEEWNAGHVLDPDFLRALYRDED